MSHLNFDILAFSANFCPIEIDMSGNTFWLQASGFPKLAKVDLFWHKNELLFTQNVNVARFARNVECDFSCDFHTAWYYVFLYFFPISGGRLMSYKWWLWKSCSSLLFWIRLLHSDPNLWNKWMPRLCKTRLRTIKLFNCIAKLEW